ncbi:MAG: hypothetical protein U0Q21_14830 [Dermatophilaceae bacterium]
MTESPTRFPADGRQLLRGVVCAVAVVTLMAGCAASANPYGGGSHPAGFWLGLWQGFIAPIAFLISLANHSIGIYAVHNAGAWYDFGFLFGISIFFSATHAGRPRRRSKRPEVPVDRS